MGKNDKLIERIESTPVRKDITPEELERYLTIHGFVNARQKGSHRTYVHESGEVFTVVVTQKPIKPCYVKIVVNLVNRIKGGQI